MTFGFTVMMMMMIMMMVMMMVVMVVMARGPGANWRCVGVPTSAWSRAAGGWSPLGRG